MRHRCRHSSRRHRWNRPPRSSVSTPTSASSRRIRRCFMKPPFVPYPRTIALGCWLVPQNMGRGQPPVGAMSTCFRSHSDTKPAALRDVVVRPGPVNGYGRASRNAASSPSMPSRSPSSSFAISAVPTTAPSANDPTSRGLPGRAHAHAHQEREVRERPEPLDELTGGPGELVPHARDPVRGHAVHEPGRRLRDPARAGRPTCPAPRAAPTRCRGRRTRRVHSTASSTGRSGTIDPGDPGASRLRAGTPRTRAGRPGSRTS